MVDAAWTFTVLFIVIFAVLIVFAVLWLMSQRPSSTGEHLPSSPSVQEILDPGLPRGEVSPDEYDDGGMRRVPGPHARWASLTRGRS